MTRLRIINPMPVNRMAARNKIKASPCSIYENAIPTEANDPITISTHRKKKI